MGLSICGSGDFDLFVFNFKIFFVSSKTIIIDVENSEWFFFVRFIPGNEVLEEARLKGKMSWYLFLWNIDDPEIIDWGGEQFKES